MSSVKNDGMLNKEELRTFVATMDKICATYGLKSRETTDELIDMYWGCFTKFISNKEGIT